VSCAELALRERTSWLLQQLLMLELAWIPSAIEQVPRYCHYWLSARQQYERSTTHC